MRSACYQLACLSTIKAKSSDTIDSRSQQTLCQTHSMEGSNAFGMCYQLACLSTIKAKSSDTIDSRSQWTLRQTHSTGGSNVFGGVSIESLESIV